MLRELFQLWVAIRMESQSERICGKETLGMEPQLFDPTWSVLFCFHTYCFTPLVWSALCFRVLFLP